MFRRQRDVRQPEEGKRPPLMNLPDTDLGQEIRRLEELRAGNPRGHTFARLADLYRKSGLPEKGLQVVEEGLAHHPHYLNAHLIHGRILRDLGRGPEATAAFRRVLDIDDENLVALQELEALDPDVGGTSLPADPPAPPRVVPSSAGERGVTDARVEPTSWLAQLEAEWQKRRDPALNGEAHWRPASEPPASTSPTDAAEVEESARRQSKLDKPQEVATATLAELYLRQSLYEEAISVYEKLLARDPYNARLAASLDEARLLSREGPRRPATHAPPVPAPARAQELPRPHLAAPPAQDDEPLKHTIREQLTAILEGRAHVSTNLESGALSRLRRWLIEAATTGGE
jgi:tetratricopeptide (TPR) repeat protein